MRSPSSPTGTRRSRSLSRRRAGWYTECRKARYAPPVMTDVAELDLPVFDPADVTLHGARFHETMTDLAEKSWLARIPLGYMTLDREAGEFFLRTKQATFPGQKIA